jgi:hypothetical protein
MMAGSTFRGVTRTPLSGRFGASLLPCHHLLAQEAKFSEPEHFGGQRFVPAVGAAARTARWHSFGTASRNVANGKDQGGWMKDEFSSSGFELRFIRGRLAQAASLVG